ncbi:hypothetical protein RhiirC2_746422 [Rhizophagus irregularis]|uniref:Transmembrane protein 188 n=1 Tax=Rhizophagus irregularis TaxID=588596 RepID=A0A2N1N998_9GLOM|nr:hypothetical protein RhiirC2_746422 [Rhizophagus irregularis]
MHTRSRNFAQINPSSSTSFESPVLPTENNPKVPLSPAFNDTTSFSNYSSTTPPNNHQRYKDLLVFEERLKQNLHQLQRRSYKYEAFLGLNCLLLPILIYAVFFYESKNPTFQFFSKLFLFIAVTTLLMFFMKNIYAEKVRVATRFVPQCNRVLRQFNMHFNASGGNFKKDLKDIVKCIIQRRVREQKKGKRKKKKREMLKGKTRIYEGGDNALLYL